MKRMILSIALFAVTAVSANAENPDGYVYYYRCPSGDVIMLQTDEELTVEEIEAWYAFAEKRCQRH